MRLSPGTRLGPFEVVAPIGAGGMGEVYRARDSRLGRDIALKVLPAELSENPDRLARFEREARAVAGLAHPNIVTLHSIEEHDGVRFLVLELIEGRDLSSLVAKSGLPIAQVLEVAIPLADALAAAHEKGIVHRDLKPANVMLARDGRLKVLDFGLARSTGADAHATVAATISEVGQVLGTVSYMSPEQIRGESVDARSDLFAFGVVLYELASGQRPFTGASSADITSSILRDTPVPLASLRKELPADLERIVERCLAKNPRDRFQTALDVLAELRRIGKAPRTAPSHEGTISIAVLPFANRSASADDEYFADGLADELLGVLGRIRGLRVVARTSSAVFKGTSENVHAIGRALDVETILEGSVRKAGNRVRIIVQLIKVADSSMMWSETYDRMLDDVFAVQDDIAQSVVKELRTTLLGKAGDSDASRDAKAEVAHAVRGRTANPEAQRLMHQGRFIMDQRTGVDRAIESLEKAVELDPDYALALVALSQAHWTKADELDDLESRMRSLERAREALDRALAIAPDLPEVHAQRGFVHLSIDLDWKRAHAAIQRALELDPRSVVVLRMATVTTMREGHLEDAAQFARRMIEADPLNALAYQFLGEILGYLGRHDEAVVALRRALELSPRRASTGSKLAFSLASLGRFDEALAEADLDSHEVFRMYGRSLVLWMMGRRQESDAELRGLVAHWANSAAAQIAALYSQRGEVDEACAWIDRGIESRDAGVLDVACGTNFAAVRQDPRWPALRKRLHYD